ncbi:hypothetical protein B0H17DRAFT_1213295 [Mycena rosella]|uniref:Alpha-1,4 glucan phosphorylase n=1 Tax=Mycena rosella TaxID=1033263 RepID=A0AAD7G476_MYCRO|nr:hypothetical protein B0H17DRAFT_1213295 [Mycena rosella]
MSTEEKNTISSTRVFVAGKAARAYYIAKLVADLRLIVNVALVIYADLDPKDLYFLLDCPVSLAEVLVPASVIISTAGTDTSGTSNMKFCAARDGRRLLMEGFGMR